MSSFANLTLTEFRMALTPSALRIGMLIQSALPAGALAFFGAVILIAFRTEPSMADEDQLSTVTMLTIASSVFFVTAFAAGHFLYASRFSETNLKNTYDSDLHDADGNPIEATPAEKALSLLRTALLIRTALLEGASFFGLATLIIASTGGFLFNLTWIWVNAIPLATLCGFVVVTFPTPARLERVFEVRIKRA